MLVLTRRLDESIIIDGNIEIKLLKISGNQVHLGIEAPRHVILHRKEVFERVAEENRRANQTDAAAAKASLSGLGGLLQSLKQQQNAPAGKD